MSTLSISLTSKLAKGVQKLIRNGVAINEADAVKKGFELLIEEHAVDVVLNAERELSEGKLLHGDLDKLLKSYQA